jgi:hypothetical protein
MKLLRTAIVLAFGLALQIGRVAVMDWLYPQGGPEWAVWTSVVVFMVLWLTLGNLLLWRLRRWLPDKPPKT